MQRGTVLETYRGSMNFGPFQCLRLWKETRKVCSQVGSPRVFWPNKCGCKALQWNQEQCQSRVLICGRMGWANARQVPEYQQSKRMQIPSLPALGLKPKVRTLQGVAIATLIIIDMVTWQDCIMLHISPQRQAWGPRSASARRSSNRCRTFLWQHCCKNSLSPTMELESEEFGNLR